MPRDHAKDLLLNSITPGDLVTISTPQGGTQRGRAVMLGPLGWVLNAGGKHGRPVAADARNILAVKAQVKPRARRVWTGYDLAGGDDEGATRAFDAMKKAYEEGGK
jgi:hypothetical protein